jgi:hypothetical protein
MDAIADAIKVLYETFARYRRPVKIECCPCGCTKPDATANLLTVPLRELSFSDLADYSCSAMTTQGSVDDFRYLLPRLFQGIAEETYSYNPEILFGKLNYAKWRDWPADEIAAVKSYLHALWETGLTTFPLEERLPEFSEIETLLASIAATGEALEPYLNSWTDNKTREADEHLIQLVTMYAPDFADGKTLNTGFWSDLNTQAKALRRWLLQPGTLLRINGAAYLVRNDGFEHLFRPAVQALEAESHRSA